MTIEQVANRAGVSPATVSRVVNQRPGVSPQHIRRVQDAIREIGYLPQRRNRAKRSVGPTVAVLMLSQDMFFHYTSTLSFMLEGLQSELAKRQTNALIARVTREQDLPKIVVERQVEGLILVGHNPDAAVLDRLAGIPTVWLTSHHEEAGDSLLPGNEDVGRLAAEYLIGRGHKRLGALNTMNWNPVAVQRASFFAYVVDQKGMPVEQFVDPPCSSGVAHEPFDPAGFEQPVAAQVDRLLKSEPRVTGLFVPFDIQTAMVHRVLQKRGVFIGRDIELIGTDDERAALAGLWPRPATISLSPAAMGRRAADQLWWRINNPGEERVRVMVQPKLIPGERV